MLMCPIRREMILTDTGPREVAAECLEAGCAWYLQTEEACAVPVMANSLYNLDQYGIKPVTHD